MAGMVEALTGIEINKMIKKYSESVLEVLENEHVGIQRVTYTGHHRCLMSNSVYRREVEKLPYVFAEITQRRDQKDLVFGFVYGREVQKLRGESRRKRRSRLISLINPLNLRAKDSDMRVVLDRDGRIKGSYPGLTLGGIFRDEDFSDVLELLNWTNNKIASSGRVE